MIAQSGNSSDSPPGFRQARILVLHAGLQHSHQLAWALYDRGLLQRFVSVVPVLGIDQKGIWWLPSRLAIRAKRVAFPKKLKSHPVAFYAFRRLAVLHRSDSAKVKHFYDTFHAFDRWASRLVSRLKPDAVVAFEDSAFHVFKEAKKIGAVCILDAPSIERRAAVRLLKMPENDYQAAIDLRKDAEVEMADVILTCSNLAAQTYLEAGVPEEKIRTLLLGASLPEGQKPYAPLPSEHGPRFVFAGALTTRKSGDLILEVFSRLESEGYKFHLTFAGGIHEHSWAEIITRSRNMEHVGQLPQAALYRLFGQNDCLLLPSRFDSFGMVVAESMACGTPAIVSTMTGSKEIILRHPGSGWIVEPEVSAIYGRVMSLLKNPDLLYKARAAALQASREYTWEAYRRRAGVAIERALEDLGKINT